MRMKFPPGDLNFDPFLPRPTSTYACGVTIALRETTHFSFVKLTVVKNIIKNY